MIPMKIKGIFIGKRRIFFIYCLVEKLCLITRKRKILLYW